MIVGTTTKAQPSGPEMPRILPVPSPPRRSSTCKERERGILKEREREKERGSEKIDDKE